MNSKIVFVFFLILVSLIFFGLIISIIYLTSNYLKSYNKQSRKFVEEKRAMEIQFLEAQIFTLEEERKRIALNFHDEINPLLTALKHQIHSIQFVNYEIDNNNNQFERMKNLIDKIILNQNEVIQNLDPIIESDEHLSLAIKQYLINIEGFKVNFEYEITSYSERSNHILKNIYNIFLELIHNILKHEKINLLDANLRIDNTQIDLVMNHDGIGLTNEQFLKSIELKEGRGLMSIKSRLYNLGATLDLISMEEGAIIYLKIPNHDAKRN